MSQGTRLFGAYINGVTIGGTSYLAVCESASIEYEFKTQMATALRDVWEYPVGIREKWKVTGKFFISTAATSGEGGPGGTLWTKALAGIQIAVSLVDNAVTGGINTLSGNGIITTATQAFGEGPQTIDVTITGQGPLASAIA
jgi:hypothetical protein